MEVAEKKPKELLQDKIFTLSNFLSISRVMLLPPFIYNAMSFAQNPSQLEYYYRTILISMGAVLTDYLDGLFARFLKQETILGRYLDPVCDKIVTIGGLSVLVLYYQFPMWILAIYLIRESAGVWLGSFLYLRRGMQGKPNWWGKIGVGIVALSVLWYISMPILKTYFPKDHIYLHPEYSGYILIIVLVFGITAYTRRYYKIVFHPEKYDLDQENKKQKKTYVKV